MTQIQPLSTDSEVGQLAPRIWADQARGVGAPSGLMMVARVVFCYLFLTNTPAMAQVSTVTIEGTLGDSIIESFSNLPSEDYAWPQLYNGSFSGTFSYDLGASPIAENRSLISFPFIDVEIAIKDSLGGLVHTITTGPNHLRVGKDRTAAILSFGPSGGQIGPPGDLRLTMRGTFAGDSAPLPSDLVTAELIEGFLETDKAESQFWDQHVSDVRFSSAETAVRPQPWGVTKARSPRH
jgi:hypothetical protein